MNTEESKNPAGESTKSFSLVSVLVKVVVLLIVLAVGAAGALYAMGGNEMQFIVKQEFNGDKDEIYKLRGEIYRMITEPEEIKKWCEGVKEFENTGDVKGHKVGAEGKVTVEVEDTKIVFDEVVTKARLNQETEVKMTSEMFDILQNFKLDYKNDAGLSSGAIILTLDYRAKFKGMSRIMAVFAKDPIETQLKENLAKLKQLVEKGADPKANDGQQKDSDAKEKGKKEGGK